MKYISLFVLICLMVITWQSGQGQSRVPYEVHATIQAELENFIRDYITAELPSATDIRFNHIWTEELEDQRIRATFEYAFTDSASADQARSTLSGIAVLSKNAEGSGWSLDEVQINNQVIEFKERDVPATE